MSSSHQPTGRGAGPDRPLVEPGRGEPDRIDPADLVARIERVWNRPPVGLILIEWDPPPGGDDPGVLAEVGTVASSTVAAAAGDGDTVVAVGARRLAVIRADPDAPAATEGLSHRLAQRLAVELERTATRSGRVAAPWAIGVAVASGDDRATDLVRSAELALNDGWLLGAQQVVVSDGPHRRPGTPDDR